MASRSALGDIGNKNVGLAKQQPDVKKTGSSLPVPNKAASKQQVKVSKIELMEVEDVTELETTVEMESETTIPDGVLDIDAQDSENPQVWPISLVFVLCIVRSLQLCSEYAPTMYAYLRTIEEGLVIKKDFLKG